MPDFSCIEKKQNFKELDGYGKQVAPLEKIGGFLNDVGEVLTKEKQFFHPGHKVLTISLLENGDILTRAEHKCKVIIFVSKRIVLSNGAKQVLHPNFWTEWFPDCTKVVLSNFFLSKSGYKQNVSEPKKVTIVGASHSGFSCAWLFLNGPKKCHKDIRIKIIYREKIRVFYENLTSAERDGYTSFDKSKFTKQENCVYGYTGLRGDARDLYM